MTKAICNNLESSGIRCWYAPRDVENAYAGSIVSAINSCSVFVLVLNRESSVSVHVLSKIDTAVQRIQRGESLTILPFLVSQGEIGDDAKYYLGRIHWIDAVTPPLEERINELKMRISKVLQKASKYEPSETPLYGTMQQIWRHAKLKSTSLLPNGNFLCRKRELAQLQQHLERFNKIFIQGMGGMNW